MLEPQKVAPNAESCSKVVGHNRDWVEHCPTKCNHIYIFQAYFKERETSSHAFMYLFSFHSDSKIPSFGKLQSIIEISNQKTLPTTHYRHQVSVAFGLRGFFLKWRVEQLISRGSLKCKQLKNWAWKFSFNCG